MNERLYSLVVLLYPAELRRNFGGEMLEVFLEDLAHRGAARVWWQTIRELCRIVLPARVSRREIAVPLATYILQGILLAALLLLSPRDPSTKFPEGEWRVMLSFGLVQAIVTYFALRVGDRSVPVPLELSHK